MVVIGILGGLCGCDHREHSAGGNLAPSTYPGVQAIVSSVALTFFAFLGFGVVTFTAKDLARPSKELPRAMFIAIGLATIIYVAVLDRRLRDAERPPRSSPPDPTAIAHWLRSRCSGTWVTG